MSNSNQTQVESVFVVTCYNQIVGVYASQEDAAQVQRELIQKNRPADIMCRPILKSLKSN